MQALHEIAPPAGFLRCSRTVDAPATREAHARVMAITEPVARVRHGRPLRPVTRQAARPRALGPHARWWQRLDERTRQVLLTDDRCRDLPVDVWGTCVASAHAEGLLEADGWFDDVSTRRLPFAAAAYVHLVLAGPA